MDEAIVERLSEVVFALEAAMARLEERQVAVAAGEEARAERIVATVASEREEELERKLAQAETKLAELQAAGSGGRKTTSVYRMAAKESADAGLAGVLDGALQSLSVEQRIAVKAELMRAGVV